MVWHGQGFVTDWTCLFHQRQVQSHNRIIKRLYSCFSGKAKAIGIFFIYFPQGNCTWTSVSGRKVTLVPINLLNISDVERLALQKICAAKLQAMDLGCPITIPKGKPHEHKPCMSAHPPNSLSSDFSEICISVVIYQKWLDLLYDHLSVLFYTDYHNYEHESV